ncbi:WxL domain-containing protein [Enterococcus sp. HY326]|uniref:WxL domain-containing protein n=1 Tax=Enterococcus sp. HY326 TaxID=2971265 RepID=UPI002240342B|nr:WxL domain-containing protein [Enterococcus sp. HY326]
MKKRSLCATTLIAALGLSLVGATTAAASTGVVGNSVVSSGSVEVTQGEAGGGGDTKDPENPTTPITPDPGEVTTPTETGTLIIQAVSNLYFDGITTGTDAVTTYARANTSTDANGPISRGAYVQWTDIRNDQRGYTLTAALTTQFTKVGGTETLQGATISYNNGIMNSSYDVGIWPEAGMLSSFTLDESGDSATVVDTGTVAADALTGKGEYFVEYGQSADWVADDHLGANKGVTDSADTSVSLFVPRNTVGLMTTGDYAAEVTWTIAVQP